MKQDESPDEEIEDLPMNDKTADPLYKVVIRRTIGNENFIGKVEDIEVGKTSRERLYKIKYTDGDLEHLSEEQVKECQMEDAGEAEDEADAEGEEEGEIEEEEGDDEGEEEDEADAE